MSKGRKLPLLMVDIPPFAVFTNNHNHRDKKNHTGDYDGLESEEDVLNLLREGKPESPKT